MKYNNFNYLISIVSFLVASYYYYQGDHLKAIYWLGIATIISIFRVEEELQKIKNSKN